MRKRLFQRWFVIVGMVAMLGSIVVASMSSHSGLANAGAVSATSSASSSAMGDMPCHKPANHDQANHELGNQKLANHKPAKPCPDCPQKMCPDMASCLVKCFQTMFPVLTDAMPLRTMACSRVAAVPSQVTAGSLIPPLLRPPSV